MSTDSDKKQNWLEKLTDRFNALMAKYDMPEDIHHEIESFVLSVAKDQYIAGNKSGISWLRKQVGAKPGQMLQAVNVAPAGA